MPWVRLEESFSEHPKLVLAGPLGMAIHVAALCYCNRFLTDGLVPAAKVPTLVDLGSLGNPEDVVARLEEAGLWERVEGGWKIHDYADYQPLRESVIEARGGLSAKRSRAGRAGAAARWQSNGNGDGKAHGKHDGKAMANGVANAWQSDGPGPGPVTEEQEHPSGAPARARAKPRGRIPGDWQPSEAHRALASELHLDVEAQALAFRDYWLGEGRPKADWDSAFRTWMRKSAEDRRPRAGPRSRDPGYAPGDLRAAADHLRAQGR